MREYDVVIVGSGPAGLATAINLLRMRPSLAGRIAAIERSRHPRLKVCAGGLIPRTVAALNEMEIPLQVPAVQVFRGIASTEAGTIRLGPFCEPLCTIVRRDQFDAMLARHAQDLGLKIIDETRVLDAEQFDSRVRLVTDRGLFDARVLVGADGSGSRVRRSVFGPAKHNVGRALVTEIPVDEHRAEEFLKHCYRFDFRCVAAGISGYAWSFPCLIKGKPHLNVGIYDQHPGRALAQATGHDLFRQLSAAFPEFDLAATADRQPAFRAFPIRWYDARDRYVNRCTILAGDAAGVDPLMGEGISCAFEHGKLAASAIVRHLEGDNGALDSYERALHCGLIGRKLCRLAFAARRFYGRHHHLYFRMAGISSKLQRLSVDWYNGARRIDELSISRAALRLLIYGTV